MRGGLIRHTECDGGFFASGASEKITPVNMLLCQFLVRGGVSRQNKIVRGGGYSPSPKSEGGGYFFLEKHPFSTPPLRH